MINRIRVRDPSEASLGTGQGHPPHPSPPLRELAKHLLTCNADMHYVETRTQTNQIQRISEGGGEEYRTLQPVHIPWGPHEAHPTPPLVKFIQTDQI